jgi:CheY-like chemotaxis protein
MTLVAVTGWGQQEDQRRSMEAGFDKHLTKPVDPMKSRISSLIDIIVLKFLRLSGERWILICFTTG